jgi:hypothetical protein
MNKQKDVKYITSARLFLFYDILTTWEAGNDSRYKYKGGKNE